MGSLKLSDDSATDAGLFQLDDPASADPVLAGGKAAALAVARRARLPVLDGFVVSTRATPHWGDGSTLPDELARALRAAWLGLSGGTAPVVVRSSSPHEDTEQSSMAGQYRSVLDVRTWDQLVRAIGEVIGSAHDEPMAVLVQPFLEPAWGGVMFGADPVTGRRDRLVVAAVPGGPDRLVSGAVTGAQFALSARGRVLDRSDDVPAALLTRSTRRALRGLARATARIFGGPQDIEWAIGHDGRLTLLQSRPITTIGHEAEASGPVLGPGPLAETFPTALAPLEEDLWIPPLRDALRLALQLIGGTSARRLRTSPVVVTVDGRPAVDLDLLGLSPIRPSRLAWLDPRPPARRLVAAWRVGRLQAALPLLAQDILTEVDSQLRAVPLLETLTPVELMRLLERSRGVLVSLHGYEMLIGQLLAAETTAPTAASRALAVLAEARATDPKADDEELVAQHPVLLSLLPPTIGAPLVLPPAPPLTLGTAASSAPARDPRAALAATQREALRLRVRWLHELTARAALTIGRELVRRGALAEAGAVRQLRLDELGAALAGAPVTGALAEVANAETPLPRAFRQAGDVIVPVAEASQAGSGCGAGGGRGVGRVHHHDPGPSSPEPPDGAVLVVATLDPGLASILPRLSGLVAETGSMLSHLAILAREYGVPTVVDLPGARERYPDGSWVVVDGATGEVSAMETEEWRAA